MGRAILQGMLSYGPSRWILVLVTTIFEDCHVVVLEVFILHFIAVWCKKYDRRLPPER